MSLTIMENIERVRRAVEKGDISATEISSLAVEAIFKGKGHQAWKDYVEMFIVDPDSREFRRLCGEDTWFYERGEWADRCLAYFVGDGVCTSLSARMGGTKRTMAMFLDPDLFKLIDEVEEDTQ